ncbi:MAG: sulfatase [Planctomycetes bacterium]|nr:sulfatase [Planctomycetota bacterium]
MKSSLFALVVGAVSAGFAGAQSSDRPNIIFVFTDDHAPHAISAYGSKINETPHIDRLAKEGMLFQRCYCGNSICAPSRATILTGKHSHQNGIIDNGKSFDGAQQTFPKLLRNVGYQTAIVGKWHLKSDPTGFDHWEVLRGQGPYYNPPLKTPNGTVKHTGYTTQILTERALKWLKGRDTKKPFMLMWQHKAPHREWAPGPGYFHKYDDVTIKEPATLFDDWKNRTTACQSQEMTIARHMSPRDLKLVPPRNLTPGQLATWNAAYGPKNEAFRKANLQGKDLVRWKYQRYIKDYLRCIAAVDDAIGHLLAYLEETGLAKNTVVIYCSDQGFFLGDHGWYDKRWMYEESFQMPFIVRWPGVTKPGTKNADLVQNIDFAETFLEMAGAKIPDDMQGKSLVPLLKGQEVAWRQSIYYHYWEHPAVHQVNRHYGVRTDRYKLIHYYRLGEWELFDLQTDPDELRSVHESPEYASIRKELEAELIRLREHYGDTDPDLGTPRIRPEDRANAANNAKLQKLFDLKKRADSYPEQPAVANVPFTVGARATPKQKTGVLVAQGGSVLGYRLELVDGRPTFHIRDRNQLFTVTAPDPVAMDRPVVIAGRLAPNGRISLWVAGKRVAQTRARLISRIPADGLSIGEDSGSAVADDSGTSFIGDLTDIRLWSGVLPARQLRNW